MLGDHIRALKDGRWLHGIDLGDQRVLYLAEAPGLAPGDRLRRVYRPEFTAGARKVELVVHREPAYPAKSVVARAWSRFMDPSVVSMFRDSEAFAAWCKIGRLPESAPTAPAPQSPMAARAAQPAPAAPAPATKAKAHEAAPGKPPAGKAPARKAAPKKSPARKSPARKAAPGKPSARKSPTRKAASKKSPARRAASRKPPARKAPARMPARGPKRASGKRKGRR